MPEPELVQLIEDLDRLRTRVNEVGTADLMGLQQMYMAASTTFNRLNLARAQAARERERQLAEPLSGIIPGYSIEAIDEAIRVARDQM
jgi:hypothetical protein